MGGVVVVVMAVIVVFEVRVQTLLQLEVFTAESAGGDGERPRRRRALGEGLSKDGVVQSGFCRKCIAAVGSSAAVASVAGEGGGCRGYSEKPPPRLRRRFG